MSSVATEALLRSYFKETDHGITDRQFNNLANIILYLSNPIIHWTMRQQTYLDARQMLPLTHLRDKLPKCLLDFLIHRFNNDPRNETIEKKAFSITFAAEKNELFRAMKEANRIQWNKEYSMMGIYIIQDDPHGHEPKGRDGWIPVQIAEQDIIVRRGSFEMYNRAVTGGIGNLQINLYGHANYWPRYLSRAALNDQPTEAERASLDNSVWMEVKLCAQRTWIYYDSVAFEYLPPFTDPTKYMEITCLSLSPKSQGITFFVSYLSWKTVLLPYPPPRGLFVDDDEEAPVQAQETTVATNSIVASESTLSLNTPLNEQRESFRKYWERGLPPPCKYIVWSKPGLLTDVCNLEDFLILLRSDSMYGYEFLKILPTITGTTTDDANIWIQYTFRDEFWESRFHPILMMNVTKLLEVYDSQLGSLRSADFLERLKNASYISTARYGSSAQEPEVIYITSNIKLPKHIRDTLVAECIDKKEICPISMEPLDATEIAITSCFHFFSKQSIEEWLKTNQTCPQCRETTSLI
jgi:hypothetical protein